VAGLTEAPKARLTLAQGGVPARRGPGAGLMGDSQMLAGDGLAKQAPVPNGWHCGFKVSNTRQCLASRH